jgi:SAM-dependent methyltransferase
MRCMQCDLLFLADRVREADARSLYSADYYDLRKGPDEDSAPPVATFRRRTAGHHLERIESFTPRGSLLDVGCGEGYFLQEARARGWRSLCGLDVSEAAVRLTSRSINAVQASLAAAPFPDRTFDVVTMFDSVEHVMTPMADLSEAARILKPGGVIYLVTPDAGGLPARLMGAGWFQLKPGEHFTLFSRKSLTRALTDAGFSDIRITRARKLLTLSFVHVILGTTNPRLARVLKTIAGALPIWNRMVPLMTGDLAVIASRRP